MILYMRDHRRMPVQTSPSVYTRDVQQDIPYNWCMKCKREIFQREKLLCPRCEGEYDNAEFMSTITTQPLPDLHKSAGSGGL